MTCDGERREGREPRGRSRTGAVGRFSDLLPEESQNRRGRAMPTWEAPVPGFQDQQAVRSHHGENASNATSPTTDLPLRLHHRLPDRLLAGRTPTAPGSSLFKRKLQEKLHPSPPSPGLSTWVTPGTGWVGLALNTTWLCPWSLSQPLLPDTRPGGAPGCSRQTPRLDAPRMLLVSKGCRMRKPGPVGCKRFV